MLQRKTPERQQSLARLSSKQGFTPSSIVRRQTFLERLQTEPPSPPSQEAVPSPPEVRLADPNKAFFDKLKTSFGGMAAERSAGKETRSLPQRSDNDASSSSVTPEVTTVDSLKENYITLAQNLYVAAASQLSDAQSSLEEQVSALTDADQAFVASLKSQHGHVCRPLSETRTEVRFALPGSSSGASSQTRTEEVHIGKHVAAISKRLAALERDLDQLWTEDCGGGAAGSSLSQAAFEKTMDGFREELKQLAEDALQEMTDSEKKYQKLILNEQTKLAQIIASLPSEFD